MCCVVVRVELGRPAGRRRYLLPSRYPWGFPSRACAPFGKKFWGSPISGTPGWGGRSCQVHPAELFLGSRNYHLPPPSQGSEESLALEWDAISA
eukprot:5774810-Amphidinium_carterae.1